MLPRALPFALAFLVPLSLSSSAGALSASATLGGKETFKVSKCGKEKAETSRRVTLSEDLTWRATGTESAGWSGTYEVANKKGTKFNLTLDEASLASLTATLAADATALCGEAATAEDVEVRKLQFRTNRKGTQGKWKVSARFLKTAASGDRKGKLNLKGKGDLAEEDAGASAAVEDVLTRLGVDIADTPRIDAVGDAYPDSYSPFGPRLTVTEIPLEGGGVDTRIGGTQELAMLGFQLAGRTAHASVIDNLIEPLLPSTPSVLYEREDADAPWADQGSPGEQFRDVAAADVDGDGLQELVFAFLEGGQVHLLIRDLDDLGAADFDMVVQAPIGSFPLAELRLAAADFDQDGADELALALVSTVDPGVRRAEGHIVILDDAAGDYAELHALSFLTDDADSSLSVVLEPGNIDYDGPTELVVVRNESAGGSPSPRAFYHVFDDALADFAELASDRIVATVDAATHPAVVADVAIGNLDADKAGEILFGGLTEIQQTCEPVEHFMMVLDDRVRGLGALAASVSPVNPPSDCPEFDPWTVAFVHANALDIDGDGDNEIQVGQYVFESVPGVGMNWSSGAVSTSLSDTLLFPSGATGGLVLERGTNALIVADMNGDGREDLVSFRQGNPDIEVYGTGLGGITRIASVAVVEESSLTALDPVLVAINPDLEGQVLEYLGDHKLIFTEPLIQAVLAAPPCTEGIGQNTDACTTTWGRFESSGTKGEASITVSSGRTVGFEVDGGVSQLEFSMKATFLTALSTGFTDAYELTKSVTFTTGPLEDAVVFTSVPLDHYTYRVIAAKDPADIGNELTLGIPRDPVTRIAERSAYNDSLREDDLRIDESVFQHTIGDTESYPNVVEKDALLQQMHSLVDDVRGTYAAILENLPLFDALPAQEGLESQVVGVGIGGGETEVAVEISQENSLGASLEIGVEVEVEATAVVIVGASLGLSTEWGFNMSFGSGTSYVGTVGSIPADQIAENDYSFGLFTYLQSDPTSGKEFQVVNYWVE